MVRWLKTNKLFPVKQVLSIVKELFVSTWFQQEAIRQWSLCFKWVSQKNRKTHRTCLNNIVIDHDAYLRVCVSLQLVHWLLIGFFYNLKTKSVQLSSVGERFLVPRPSMSQALNTLEWVLWFWNAFSLLSA